MNLRNLLNLMTLVGFLVTTYGLASPTDLVQEKILEEADARCAHCPALDTATESRNPHIRELAANAFGKISKPESVAHLINLLNSDKNPGVIRETIFSLGQLFWTNSLTPELESLILKELQNYASKPISSKLEISISLVDALSKAALTRAPEILLPYLRDKRTQVRATALEGLTRYRLILKTRDPNIKIDDFSEPLIQTALESCSSPSPGVRSALAYMLARTKDQRGADCLLKLAVQSDAIPEAVKDWSRFFALNALAKIKEKKALEPALLALKSKDYKIITEGLGILSAIQKSSAIDESVLLSLKTHQATHVRLALVNALVQDPNVKDAALRVFLNDKSPNVIAAAILGISKLKPLDLETLLQGFNKPDLFPWMIREILAEASSPLALEKRFVFLESLLKDPDVRVRAASLDAIGAIEGPKAFAILKDNSKSTELSERGTIGDLLSKRKEKERLALGFDLYQTSLDEKWIELREGLVDLFISESSPETSGYLKVCAADPSDQVRTKARAELKKRGLETPPDQPALANTQTPFFKLRFKLNPVVIFKTSRGLIEITLWPKLAPIHVANLVGHVKAHTYDGLPFHRVVSDFVVQGGDSDKTGWGGGPSGPGYPRYSMRAEFNQTRFERGILGMPRSAGLDTGGMQLFLMLAAAPHLNMQYTAFGKITKGLDVLDQIEKGDLIIKATLK